MRSTSRISLFAIVVVCVSLGGCEALTRAPGEAPAPAPRTAKAETPAPSPAQLEPAVAAESRQLYQQALAALGAARYAEAERGLLAVARREPQLAGPHANLGILYGRTGRP